MRRTHSFEIVGIGQFDEYPAHEKDIEYPTTTKDGKPLVKKLLTKGMPSEYGWMDNEGKVYSDGEVYREVNNHLVQKVKRTERVNKFKYIRKDEISPLDMSTSFLEPANQTTKDALKNLLKDGMALKFQYKKSSVGFKWVKAFIFEEDGEFIMVTGSGDKRMALELFKANKQAKVSSGAGDMPGEVVVVSADEVEPDID